MDFFRRRIILLIEYLIGYKAYSSYVKPEEILRMLTEPSLKNRAFRYIENITGDLNSPYLIVKLKTCENPLYWPKKFDIRELYQVISEVFNERDWHYYEAGQTIVCDKDIVVDCGASEGAFSIKNYTKSKFTYIVEPIKTFADSLNKTFENAGNVEIINCALGDGSLKEVGIDENTIFSSVSSNSLERVRSCTIDELFFDKHITYIKADVEGSEMMLLNGAAKTIAKERPKMAIATYHDANDWRQMLNFVKNICPDYKYRINGIYHMNRKPVLLHMWV
ncbi:MAG: FkbM family methyltransferase [Candidatus Omnitrophota bacterium]|jgi:FkbM family methyltransferase